MTSGFIDLPDWTLLGCGAYFAYVEHPYPLPSDQFAKALVTKASLLTLPGTMFQPHGSRAGERQLRIAFANIDATGITEFFRRLKHLTL
jgi:aspartate/methionine/tyrosine aminotransferase